MSPGPTIGILTHSTDNFHDAQYFIRLMIPRWEAMGFRLVVLTEADAFVPADIAFLHVDLSVVPDSCRRLSERYGKVVNGRVLDISKRRISRLIVRREEAYSGAVIVKSNYNCGGQREFQRRMRESPIAPVLKRLKIAEPVRRRLEQFELQRSWRRRRLFPYGQYPVFENCELVPEGVWANPNLVVERFLAEREDGLYCCRHWLFLGGKEVMRRTVSREPNVKANARIEQIRDPVPEELRAMRQELGFDYGKFDYGIVEGKVVVYDVNKTPGYTADVARHTQTVDALCEGIWDLVGG